MSEPHRGNPGIQAIASVSQEGGNAVCPFLLALTKVET
jgi:hypothetical protein